MSNPDDMESRARHGPLTQEEIERLAKRARGRLAERTEAAVTEDHGSELVRGTGVALLVGWIIGLLKMLRPPRMLENGDRDLVEKVQLYEVRLRRWREIVWYALLVLTAGLATEVSLSWGLTRFYDGFEPKTKAELSAAEASRRTTRIETRLLEQSLLSIRQGQCRSTTKSYFTERLNELMGEYQHLTGREWREPACDEVIQ